MWKHIDADTMKRYVKLYASAMHGYDCVTVSIDGHRIIEPKSVAKATNDDMANKLIPTVYELALEWGCPVEQMEAWRDNER
jgi:hypothetical protein